MLQHTPAQQWKPLYETFSKSFSQSLKSQILILDHSVQKKYRNSCRHTIHGLMICQSFMNSNPPMDG